MNFEAVSQFLAPYSKFRMQQLLDAVRKGATNWSEVKGWPDSLKQSVNIPFLSYTQSQVLTSTDGTRKAALTLRDGAVIETVLMQPKPGLFSVCVSSEVGCPMGCSFCATGKMGFKRALTAEEITDQWLFWRSFHPTHLVFMGMGEPFHNQASVFMAIKHLHEYFQVGWRKMSISTCGIIPGIENLAQTYPQVNLAISLHAANPETRAKLMPIAKAYSLPQLHQALHKYLQVTNRQLMFEYILLAGVNDSQEDLNMLINWLTGLPINLVHINLIRFNPTDSPFKQPEKEIVYRWQSRLEQQGISVSIRKNLGTDIFGACGQLSSHPNI